MVGRVLACGSKSTGEESPCDPGNNVTTFVAYLSRQAAVTRRRVVESLHEAGGGHFGGSLSVVDILVALYEGIVRLSPDNLMQPDRDRIILSKGHAAIALYAVLAARKIVPLDSLRKYGRFGAQVEGHPDMTATRGVDFSTGSLGQGIAIGAGMALALRETRAHVWVIVGDGECQEGEIWEAALLAARYRLSNLHVIVDCNGAQEFGWKHRPDLDSTPVPQMLEKWRAFGWTVHDVDGHDLADLLSVFQGMAVERAGERPSIAVARTRKGRGCALFEGDPERYHCTNLTSDEYRRAIEEMTWKQR